MRKPPPPPPPALEKRPQPGRLRAIILAVLVHGAFFALIVFGVTWQSRPPPPLEAELWDKLPPAKAKAPPPPPAPEKVEPEPPKPEPPKPEPPKPEPPKPEPPKPPPPKPEPPKPDPAIAEKAERLKKEKEKRERLEQEKLERQKKEEAAKKKDEAAKKKRDQEEAAKKKREDEDRARQEKEKQLAEQRVREEAARARSTEIAAWTDRIKAKIRSRANIPDTVTGNPEPRFLIRVLPGGEVLDITLTKPSGNRAYDAAIERAIRSASPLPVPPASSELFPTFRELNLDFRHER